MAKITHEIPRLVQVLWLHLMKITPEIQFMCFLNLFDVSTTSVLNWNMHFLFMVVFQLICINVGVCHIC